MTARVAVVTGAARGIGAAAARRLADDGRAVAVLDLDGEGARTVAEQITRTGGAALPLQVDVTDADQVERAVGTVAAQLGPPQILVNNAGVIRDNLVHKMTVDDWDAVLGVHLRGAFLLTRAVQSFMVSGRWGRIVNLSSVSALGNRGQANYSAAKAGIVGLTKTLALELGPFGVVVNAVAPGFIVTDMTRATAARLGVDFDQLVDAAAQEIPVRRVGLPQDVAAVIAFLAGDDVGFVSGQVIQVAGGPR